MTIKLSDEEREAIVREASRPTGARWDSRLIDATLAHLNRQQEPDRFLVMGEKTADIWETSNRGDEAQNIATYLREQWELEAAKRDQDEAANRAELLKRVLDALERGNGIHLPKAVPGVIREEFAR